MFLTQFFGFYVVQSQSSCSGLHRGLCLGCTPGWSLWLLHIPGPPILRPIHRNTTVHHHV